MRGRLAPAFFFPEWIPHVSPRKRVRARVKTCGPKLGPKILAALLTGRQRGEDRRKSRKFRRNASKGCCATNCSGAGSRRPRIMHASGRASRDHTRQTDRQGRERAIAGDRRILRVLDRLDRYHGFGKLARGGRRGDDEQTRLSEVRRRGSVPPPPRVQPRASGVSPARDAERAPTARPIDGARETSANCGSSTPAEARPARRLRQRECEELFYDWSFGRAPTSGRHGDWIYWLILAGRGAGKTRARRRSRTQMGEEFRLRQPDRPDR